MLVVLSAYTNCSQPGDLALRGDAPMLQILDPVPETLFETESDSNPPQNDDLVAREVSSLPSPQTPIEPVIESVGPTNNLPPILVTDELLKKVYSDHFFDLIKKNVEVAKPIKLLLVVDNSKSMLLTLEKLTASLVHLLSPLKDREVEVKLITTTSPLESSDPEFIRAQGWKKITADLKGKPQGEIKRLTGALETEEFGLYSYWEYIHLADNYRFTFQKSDPEFDVKLTALKESILSLVRTASGSREEKGLCSILMALHDRGPHAFFKTGDAGAVVVVSDENDQSLWNPSWSMENRVSCRNTYIHGSLVDKASDRTVKRDSLNFNVFSTRYDVHYEYVNDGVKETRIAYGSGGHPLPLSQHPELKEKLLAGESVACPESLLAQKVLPFEWANRKTKNLEIKNCQIKSSWTARYQFAPETANVCDNPFTKDSENFLNLSDYVEKKLNALLVPKTCRHDRSEQSPQRSFGLWYFTGATDSLLFKSHSRDTRAHQEDIKKAIANQALSLFKPEDFNLFSLVHKDNSCMKDSQVQSVGADYIQALTGTALESRGSSASLCEEDYSLALKDLSVQVFGGFERVYNLEELNFSPGLVKIASVDLVRGPGETLRLNPGGDYNLDGFILTLSPGLELKTGDRLKINLEVILK